MAFIIDDIVELAVAPAVWATAAGIALVSSRKVRRGLRGATVQVMAGAMAVEGRLSGAGRDLKQRVARRSRPAPVADEPAPAPGPARSRRRAAGPPPATESATPAPTRRPRARRPRAAESAEAAVPAADSYIDLTRPQTIEELTGGRISGTKRSRKPKGAPRAKAKPAEAPRASHQEPEEGQEARSPESE